MTESTHLIAVSDTYQRFVIVPRDAANAADLARFHDGQVQGAATQDDREYHQRAASWYLDQADELAA